MKKWNKVLLSAAMVNTVLAPVAVSHATTIVVNPEQNEIDHITSIYNAIFPQPADKAIATKFRTDLKNYISYGVNYSPADVDKWFTVNGTNLKPIISQHLTAAGINKSAEDYVTGLLPLFAPDGATLSTDIQTIRTNYSGDFDKLFGTSVTVDGALIPFASDLETQLKNPTVWGTALSSSNMNSSLVDTVLQTAVNQLLANQSKPYANLDGKLSSGLGISMSQLLEIRKNVTAAFVAADPVHQNDYDQVKSKLVTYALSILNNNGGGGGGGDIPTPPVVTGGTGGGIPTDGKTIVTPKTDVTIVKNADGTSVTVVKLDEAALLQEISKSTDSKAVVVPVNTTGGTAKVSLSADLLTNAASNNANSSFIMAANGSSYELPVSLINKSNIAQALGISESDLSNVNVDVVITEKPQADSDAVAAHTGGKVVSKVVDFSIVVSNGDHSTTLNNFGSTYVNRAFDLTATVDNTHAVGVVINADGSVAPVPTVFTKNGDTNVAILKRNGNSAYTVLSNDVYFKDIDKSWAKADIKLLADKMIISGYEDGTFHPNDSVTRGQFATLLARGLGLSKSTNAIHLKDVQSNAYYAGYVQALVDAGIVNGFSDGTYRANDKIARQDAIILLAKAIEFLKLRGNVSDADAATALAKFKDSSKVSGYAATASGIMSALKLISGDDNGNLNPKSNTSRAETVIMIEKLLTTANFLAK